MKTSFPLKIVISFLLLFSITYSPTFAAEIDDVRTLVESEYVDDVSDSVLQRDSIDTILSELDPYSTYFSKEEYDSFIGSIERNYTGIGVVVELVEKGIVVLSLFEESDAIRAGIEPGDVITKADGTVLEGLSLEQGTALIRGKEGTMVTLTINRPSTGKTFVVDVVRKRIAIPTVEYEKLAGNIGYIRLYSFNDQTVPQMKEAIKALQGVEEWIIDIRDNSGGYLHTAREVAGFFPKVETAVQIEERQQPKRGYSAIDQNVEITGDIHLLMNQSSASASEILAGALKDSGSATLYGQNTFGKGLVQELYRLQNGDVLKLTVARFYTPKGNEIQEVGISPDKKTAVGNELYQAHLDFMDQTIMEVDNSIASDGGINVTLQGLTKLDALEKKLELYQLGGKSIPVDVFPNSLTTFSVLPKQPQKEIGTYLLVSDKNAYKFDASLVASSDTISPFRDVRADAYFAKPIMALYGEGIIKGVGDAKFAPYYFLTRQDAAVMFARLLKLDLEGAGSSGFQDVPHDAYYSDAIAAVKAAGVMNGRSTTIFGTGDILTREEMAALIARAFKLDTEAEIAPFEDITNSVFKSDIIKIYENNITTGLTPTSFAPNRAVTRGDFATFLYRAMQLQANETIEIKEIQ